jgi:TonB family protein
VQVGYDVSPGGTVQDLAVAKSNPEGVFDEAALAVVRSWRYCPGHEIQALGVGVFVRTAHISTRAGCG